MDYTQATQINKISAYLEYQQSHPDSIYKITALLPSITMRSNNGGFSAQYPIFKLKDTPNISYENGQDEYSFILGIDDKTKFQNIDGSDGFASYTTHGRYSIEGRFANKQELLKCRSSIGNVNQVFLTSKITFLGTYEDINNLLKSKP